MPRPTSPPPPSPHPSDAEPAGSRSVYAAFGGPLRPVRPAGWWFDAVLLAVFVMVTVAVAAGWTAGLDLAVRDFCDAHRPAAADAVARGLNLFGQGWLLTYVLGGGLTAVLLLRVRDWRALLPGVTAFLLTYLTVGPLKLWTHRAAPGDDLTPDPVRLFNPDIAPGGYARSYPSGHVVNAMVWWVAIVVLAVAVWATFGRTLPDRARRVARIAPPVIVLCTTTYLAFHWITDGVAALALGLVLVRLMDRVAWPILLRRPD